MNERFAADPQCCGTADELRRLLEKFGTHTGRYLVGYPNAWREAVERQFKDAPPLEKKRVIAHFEHLKKRLGLLEIPSLPWLDHQPWIENAIKYANEEPRVFDGLLVNTDGHKPCSRIHKFEDWNPHPTSEERIVATASEYERVSQTLLRHSQELVFVDPYLNLCNQRVEPVVSRLLATVANGICQKLTFVARARDVLPESGSKSINNLKNEFNRIKNQIRENKSLKLSYLLVNDSYRSNARMHDRFILSAKGGIEFSQGFQELPKMGKITARPIQEIPFKEYCEIYIDVKNNMKIDHDL